MKKATKEATKEAKRGRNKLPASDKKVVVRVFIPSGIIKAKGGIEKAKQIAINAIVKTQS